MGVGSDRISQIAIRAESAAVIRKDSLDRDVMELCWNMFGRGDARKSRRGDRYDRLDRHRRSSGRGHRSSNRHPPSRPRSRRSTRSHKSGRIRKVSFRADWQICGQFSHGVPPTRMHSREKRRPRLKVKLIGRRFCIARIIASHGHEEN